MNQEQFWLTGEQFAKIAPHLPNDTRGKERVDDRRVISGIVHVLEIGRSVGGRAARLRSEEDALQPLCPMGGERRLGRRLRGARAGRRAIGAGAHRLVGSESPSLGGGRKTYGPPRRQVAFGDDLSCLHKRIRPFGEPLAKMEIRAFRSS